MAFYESYLGIQPDLGLFCRLFRVRPQVQFTKGPLVVCGGASIYSRAQTGYPKFLLHDTVRLWQQSYFYVKNATNVDRINLPAFQDVEFSRQNWELKIHGDKAETDAMLQRMRSLVTCRLTGLDITLSWMSRLMMLLQQRVHKMCFYSGWQDPTRLSRRDPPSPTSMSGFG